MSSSNIDENTLIKWKDIEKLVAVLKPKLFDDNYRQFLLTINETPLLAEYYDITPTERAITLPSGSKFVCVKLGSADEGAVPIYFSTTSGLQAGSDNQLSIQQVGSGAVYELNNNETSFYIYSAANSATVEIAAFTNAFAAENYLKR